MRGFTLIEILLVVGIIALLIGILVPVIGTVRESAQRTTDSGQLRAIAQGFAGWAGQNNARYPLPSQIDVSNTTIAETDFDESFQKDTTGAIFSVLLFNDFVATEILISPVETNGQIREDGDFNLDGPDGAANAQFGLWDPDFRGTPGDVSISSDGISDPAGTGNLSYAHLPPFGPRIDNWTSTAGSDSAFLANRGQVYADSQWDGTNVTFQLNRNDVDPTESNTLEFFTPNKEWAGHIAYNDASVEFNRNPAARGLATFENEGTVVNKDNVFMNEQPDAVGRPRDQIGQGANAYLRGYTNIAENGPDREDATAEVFDQVSGYQGGD